MFCWVAPTNGIRSNRDSGKPSVHRPRLGRAELPAGAVAVAVHNPVPNREITALHRRSMSQSPAVTAIIEALRR